MSKVAVVGAGRWGSNLVRVFYEKGELAAVAEASPELRQQLRESYPDVPVHESVDTLLQSDIPALAIATPAASHFVIAHQALLAGKDVFVEKPITLTVAEAQQLDRLASRMGSVLMAGHLLLYQPAIQWIKQYIDSGELGCLYSIHQRRAQLGRVRSVENALWSLGVHDIAVLLYLTGDNVQEIASVGQRVLQEQIEDDVHVHLTFPGKVRAHLHTSWLWPVQERRLVVIGSRGMLEFDEFRQRVTLHRRMVRDDLSCQDHGSEVIFEEKGEPLQREIDHFLSCMESRETPISGGRSGVAVMKVLEEASLLWKEGES